MKYIDADLLLKEIEKKSHEEQGFSSEDSEYGYRSCARDLLAFINSLQQEQSEVDLEKELDNYMDGYFSECQDGTLLNDGGSELQYEDVYKIARHFYELGRTDLDMALEDNESNRKLEKQINDEAVSKQTQ